MVPQPRCCALPGDLPVSEAIATETLEGAGTPTLLLVLGPARSLQSASLPGPYEEPECRVSSGSAWRCKRADGRPCNDWYDATQSVEGGFACIAGTYVKEEPGISDAGDSVLRSASCSLKLWLVDTSGLAPEDPDALKSPDAVVNVEVVVVVVASAAYCSLAASAGVPSSRAASARVSVREGHRASVFAVVEAGPWTASLAALLRGGPSEVYSVRWAINGAMHASKCRDRWALGLGFLAAINSGPSEAVARFMGGLEGSLSFGGCRSALRRLAADSVESAPTSRAYCALLHGSEDYFIVYALVVGLRLKRLCGGADRVLLCNGHWWQDHAARTALECVYTRVMEVPLISAPHATKLPRHEQAFTKLQALRLPYRHVVFLDIDLVPRVDLSPLFEVEAPAGMYHGEDDIDSAHGGLIQRSGEGSDWCVNAGVLRLDPRETARAREQELEDILGDVMKIDCPSALPEQYYIVERFTGWRHLDCSWNMEVGPLYGDPGFTWPRDGAREASVAPRSRAWSAQAVEDVRVFHFSGRRCHPWWYVDLSPQEAFEHASVEFCHRDPRRLVATAVREWRLALDELVAASLLWPPRPAARLQDVVARLRQRAAEYRAEHRRERCRLRPCHRCALPVKEEEEGRWLIGWEGWWLCRDCVVGYVFSEECPPPQACIKCGQSEVAGAWSWEGSTPGWTCEGGCPGRGAKARNGVSRGSRSKLPRSKTHQHGTLRLR